MVLGFGVFFDHTAATTAGSPEAAAALQADLARQSASANVREIAQWAIDSGDHAGLPFVVVDKERARLFAFDGMGRLQASAPVLLGALRGDAPDVPATPAGRFITDTWQSAQADAIVWVNGDVALSLHALPSPASPGRGLQRLASDRVEDKRISDGSLHVASDFYQQFLAPLRNQGSVAYVLPEVQALHGMLTAPGVRVARSPGYTATRRPS
ncbi:MAG: hypothetical protein Q8R01_15715 [Ramlibacter sp.]|nr:hypothetical protein [Ramlibacter sp.]